MLKMKLALVSLGLLGGLVTAASANAPPPSAKPIAGHRKLDPAERATNRDARATALFAKLDKNGDGKLTLDEFKAREPRPRHRHHRRHGAPAPTK